VTSAGFKIRNDCYRNLNIQCWVLCYFEIKRSNVKVIKPHKVQTRKWRNSP